MWRVLTTSEGLRCSLAPVVQTDFCVGSAGRCAANPEPRLGDSTKFVNEVVAVVPWELFATRSPEAPGFRSRELAKQLLTASVIRTLAHKRYRLSSHFRLRTWR